MIFTPYSLPNTMMSGELKLDTFMSTFITIQQIIGLQITAYSHTDSSASIEIPAAMDTMMWLDVTLCFISLSAPLTR